MSGEVPYIKIREQFQINPHVLAAPLCQCFGGPADGLFRRVPPGYILIVVWAGDEEMNALAIEPSVSSMYIAEPIDVVALCKTVGTYVGHYTRLGNHLRFVDS